MKGSIPKQTGKTSDRPVFFKMPKATDRAAVIYGSSIDIKTRNSAEVIRALKTGLPVSSFEKLQKNLNVTTAIMAATVNIAPRTLARRKKEGRLHTDESERVLRVAKLYDRAIEVLNDSDLVQQWFKSPKKALGGQTPLEFADTEPGAREVEDLLGRIEHGVFS